MSIIAVMAAMCSVARGSTQAAMEDAGCYQSFLSFGRSLSRTPNCLKIQLHLSQETLAQLIGSTRQHVNQILKDWDLEGVVEQQYGQITLLDQARLELARL
jgi:CRP-like cAMP-binding protein